MRDYTDIENVMRLAKAGIALTTKQAAIYCGNVNHRSIERYRTTGEGPRFLRVGRVVRYRIQDLDEWLSSRVFNSTSERSKNHKPF